MGIVSSFFYKKDIELKVIKDSYTNLIFEADDYINTNPDKIIYKNSIEEINNKSYFFKPYTYILDNSKLFFQNDFSNILTKNTIYYKYNYGFDILNKYIINNPVEIYDDTYNNKLNIIDESIIDYKSF